MRRRTIMRFMTGAIMAGTLLAACGGGGDTPQGQTPVQPGSVSVLAWAPPATYNDNTSMDPYVDLDYYELYLRQDGNFTDNDLPVLQVAAVYDATSQNGQPVAKALVTEFDLGLIPDIPEGNRFHVSMRAIGIDGQKSAFMAPVVWDRI